MTSQRFRSAHGSSREEDRRVARRLRSGDVPWLKAIRPNITGAATLINISRTGVLFDTHERLAPGRRTTVAAATQDDRLERLAGMVVRTSVVSIAGGAGLLYRAALEFESAFPWELAEPEPEAEPLPERAAADLLLSADLEAAQPEQPEDAQLASPVDGLFSSDSGSHVVSVTNLTEMGCVVRTTELVKPGGFVSLALLFSDSSRPMLTGRVTSVTSDGRCLVRFVNLAATERNTLRMELRRHALRTGRALGPRGDAKGGQHRTSGASMRVSVAGQFQAVHAAQW